MTDFLPILYWPNRIFKKKAEKVEVFDDALRRLLDRLIKTLYIEQAIGIAAPMVGILKRIIIVDLKEGEINDPQIFINPEIIYRSEELQTFNEASICFPGISADIIRPKFIKLNYLDYNGAIKTLEAEGFLSSVLQHEIDYLEGKIFLDHISKLKSDILLKKMQKYIKLNPVHIHGEHCKH